MFKSILSNGTKKGFLEGIKVKNVKGEEVTISDCWRNQTVVLKVLRRFGCPLCRYEARLLSDLKPHFDDLSIKLVAVGIEDVGFTEFLTGEYWDWEILIDSERNIHKMLNLAKLPVLKGLKDLFNPATRAAISAAQKAGISGNMKGDGYQLGGLFVLEKGTGNVMYALRQVGAASCASLKEVYQSCGGDPDEIEERAPEECIVSIRNNYDITKFASTILPFDILSSSQILKN